MGRPRSRSSNRFSATRPGNVIAGYFAGCLRRESNAGDTRAAPLCVPPRPSLPLDRDSCDKAAGRYFSANNQMLFQSAHGAAARN